MGELIAKSPTLYIMDFKNSYTHSLIYSKANFATIRKAEQIAVLCYVRYYLENDMVGDAIKIYKKFEDSYPEEIESQQLPLTDNDIARIIEDDIYCMPWSYIHLLEEMASYAGKSAALDEKLLFAKNVWFTPRPEHVSSQYSFSYTYETFMKDAWIKKFIDLFHNTVWPLTSADTSNKTSDISAITAVNDSTDDVDTVVDDASVKAVSSSNTHLIKTLDKHLVERMWPYMRVKNTIKKINYYSNTKSSLRISHYDGLLLLARHKNLDIHQLLKTPADVYMKDICWRR